MRKEKRKESKVDSVILYIVALQCYIEECRLQSWYKTRHASDNNDNKPLSL